MILLLVPLISLIAFGVAQTPVAQSIGLGALPVAIILGILAGNLFVRHPEQPKETWLLNFSKKRLLRGGIILFGSHLTLQQLWAVGWQAALLDAVIISAVMISGYLVGVRLLNMGREETILTSVGSAVCGAAAILATEPVLKAKQRDVSVAVATVVVFGTLALFCYPVIFALTDVSSEAFGIYIGSTVHEVAQAVAAGQSIDAEAMNNAIIVKLMRVMMLAPVVIAIAWLYQKATLAKAGSDAPAKRTPIPWPWFVFGFIGMVTLNSVVILPETLIDILKLSAQLALTVAMAALGIQTKFSAIRSAGTKPLLLSAFLFVLLLGGGFGAHQLLY